MEIEITTCIETELNYSVYTHGFFDASYDVEPGDVEVRIVEMNGEFSEGNSVDANHNLPVKEFTIS
jgi:hypothetical protein